jgi:tRNA A-37 threonylcarbamoyl transferase component Bud32
VDASSPSAHSRRREEGRRGYKSSQSNMDLTAWRQLDAMPPFPLEDRVERLRITFNAKKEFMAKKQRIHVPMYIYMDCTADAIFYKWLTETGYTAYIQKHGRVTPYERITSEVRHVWKKHIIYMSFVSSNATLEEATRSIMHKQ